VTLSGVERATGSLGGKGSVVVAYPAFLLRTQATPWLATTEGQTQTVRNQGLASFVEIQ
jgi:hypothetical protein